MRTGQLRHLIRIEAPIQVKTTTGAITTTWELFRQVWAGYETFKGNERIAAQAAWPKSDGKFLMRYVADILPTYRIVFEGRIYSILNINDIEMRHREMEIATETGVKSA